MSTVCHVIDYGAQTSGSFIPALENLSRSLSARGDTFAVVASEVPGAVWPAELQQSGADVRLVRSARDVLAQLRDVRPDIIHSHFTRFDVAAALWSGAADVYWHVHSHRENYSAAARVKALVKNRVLGRYLAGMITVSHAMYDECLEWFGPRQRLCVVYNGIDCSHFRPPSAQERAAARGRLGIADGERIVLFFDRVPYKGGAVVAESLGRLPGVRLLVAAPTAPLCSLSSSRVIALERLADARQLYWAADALAFASNREAFGLVLVEAMACGLPIAASDIPVVHEICDGAESVFLFPVGDSNALAAALERALACTSTAPARSRACSDFTLERWTRDTLAIYDGSRRAR